MAVSDPFLIAEVGGGGGGGRAYDGIPPQPLDEQRRGLCVGIGFRVWGLGSRIWASGLGFRVRGSGFGVWG